MKINIGKLLRIAGHVIVAVPIIIKALKPVLRKRRRAELEPARGLDTLPLIDDSRPDRITITPE